MLKCISLGLKVAKLVQPDEPWFQDAMQLSGLDDICRIIYGYINHGLLSAFVE